MAHPLGLSTSKRCPSHPLPHFAVDAIKNSRSYEYGYAGRAEQYYGPMEWDAAWPLLQRRLGVTARGTEVPARTLITAPR